MKQQGAAIETLKTQTLGASDPVVTILEGHHDIDAFNRAFAAEGWDHKGWDEENISHEYWVKKRGGLWEPSVKTHPDAIAVTVGDW